MCFPFCFAAYRGTDQQSKYQAAHVSPVINAPLEEPVGQVVSRKGQQAGQGNLQLAAASR